MSKHQDLQMFGIKMNKYDYCYPLVVGPGDNLKWEKVYNVALQGLAISGHIGNVSL